MKLSTQDRPFFGQNFKEKLLKVESLGFEGLEIGGDVLINNFGNIQEAVRETGIPISSICGGYRGWIGAFDEEKRKQAINDIGEIFKYTSEVGAEGVIAPAAFGMFSRKLPPFEPPRTESQDKEVLLEALHQLDKLASETGSRLLLEPLNRYEDHMINRLEEARTIINEGGFTCVKILADFFHMNMEEAEISRSILDTGDLIGHVHLADSNRLQPGEGHIDFKEGFQSLKSVGYNKYLTIECGLANNSEKDYIEMRNYLSPLIDSL